MEKASAKLVAKLWLRRKSAMRDDYQDDEDYKELLAYLKRNYTEAGKSGWVAKGGGLVLMESWGEVTPWMFSMMPMHMSFKNLLGKGGVYQPATESSPEGIVLNPHWVNVNPNGLSQAASLETIDALKNPVSAKEIVESYFKAVEQKAGVKIPSWIKSKYVGKAESIAARRWKAKNITPKDTFVPFDKAYKPQSMGSMTVPRYNMASKHYG